jgi:uncharacterized membrane protein YeaQ/YmgE (transglycosylase-associated protein family)
VTLNMLVFTSLVVGGLIGWLSRMLAVGRPPLNMAMSVVVGAGGSLLGSWLVTPLLAAEAGAQDSVSLTAISIAVAGAIVLLGAAGLTRRMSGR